MAPKFNVGDCVKFEVVDEPDATGVITDVWWADTTPLLTIKCEDGSTAYLTDADIKEKEE